MNEIEVRGFIQDKYTFLSLIKKFKGQEYEYKEFKRLSVVSGDYSLRNLETRLRITDGKITFAQKKGDVGAITREEIEFKLEIVSKDFFKLSKIIENLSEQTPDPYCVIIQHENYLFSKGDMEIKLFRQFGNSDFFGYEVEKENTSEEELKELVENLGLEISEDFDDDSKIRERNTKVNIPLSSIEDSKLKEIIESYFN